MKNIITLFLLISSVYAQAQMHTDTFRFSFEGRKYVGFVDQPEHTTPKALVVIIPGSGETDIVAGNWYHGLRSHFTAQGLACCIWDKAGCGKSEGVFDDLQPIQNSAQEAIAAIEELKREHVPGSSTVGLWGLSRGGWVCPMIIANYPSIAFWISVSGPIGEENFAYLLTTNFRIEGRSEAQTQLLVSEWKAGYEIHRKGGTFEQYQNATQNLRKDSFWLAISGSPFTKEGFARTQKSNRDKGYTYNEQTGMRIYVPEFDKILSKVNCPVLALYGEKDSQVDWRRSIAVYKKNIGNNPKANLTVKTFPDGNHVLDKCKTGGIKEKLENEEHCDGYYETMQAWLKEKGFGG